MVTNLRNDLNEVHKNLAIHPGRAHLLTKAQKLLMELEVEGMTKSKAWYGKYTAAAKAHIPLKIPWVSL